jgi:AraC family transcriptional regulator, alkane utilization regulator
MTGTPQFFADPPHRVADTHASEILSEVLRTVRLTGAVFLNAVFTAPFGLVSPKRYDARMPMAHLRHVSVFHLISAGGCMVETASGERRQLAAGDLVLMPFADTHKFWSGEAPEMVFAPNLVHRGPLDGIWTLNYGGAGAATKIICGFLESSELLATPLFRSLPEMLVERTGDEKVGALIASTAREVLALVEASTPGTQVMLGRMMEILFVEVLRRHAARLPSDSKGWLAAVNDPVVGRALELVHKDPARKWSAADLAREAGASRTVLAERFNQLLGRPPIDYVTSWRIQLAADRLRNGRDTIATVAATVGYESEAAFNRAFKRVVGMSPGRWRDGGGDSPDLMPIQLNRPLVPPRPTAS